MSKARSRFLKEHPEEKIRFVLAGWNAPTPTTLEKVVILEAEGLDVRYVGDGSFWISTPEGRRLNPDFIAHGKRVILADGAYWHPPKQIEEETKAYESAGYRVLRIPEEQIKKRPESIRGVIIAFLNG
jgi:hypothetical protein